MPETFRLTNEEVQVLGGIGAPSVKLRYEAIKIRDGGTRGLTGQIGHGLQMSLCTKVHNRNLRFPALL